MPATGSDPAHGRTCFRPAKQADDRSSGRLHRGAGQQNGLAITDGRRCPPVHRAAGDQGRGHAAEGALDDLALGALEIVTVHALQEPHDLGVRREAERVLAVLEQDLERLVRGRAVLLEVVVALDHHEPGDLRLGRDRALGISRSMSYFGGGISRWTTAFSVAAGIRMRGQHEREPPARARVQPALGDQLDPLAPRQQRRLHRRARCAG